MRSALKSACTWLMACVLLGGLTAPHAGAVAKGPQPELTRYWRSYAAIGQGAIITSPSKLHGGFELEGLIGGKGFPQGRDSAGVIFADNVAQREELTIDLGRTRKLGMIVFECELARRTPKSLKIETSNKSASGPWRVVLSTTDVLQAHTIGIDDGLPARWIHVDMGVRSDGIGSRVARLKVFPRFHLLKAAEVVQTLSTHYRRDAPELGAFWKAIDARKWDVACDELIRLYSDRSRKARGESQPGFGGKPPERALAWMANRVESGGQTYQFDSSDWNWLAGRPGSPSGGLGLLPGAYSIFNDFANAYLATGSPDWSRKTAELLTDWLQDNPYPAWDYDEDDKLIGAWTGLVASGRCGVFSKMVDVFFAENRAFTRDLKMNLLLSVWQHMEFLHAIRVHLAGNWLTNVNSSLFDSALEHPEFAEQKQWLKDSLQAFETSLTRDVFPCGREVEDSTMYVPMASSQMLSQYAQVRRAGLKLSDECERKMSLLWDTVAWMHYPDGSRPSVGDCGRQSPLKPGNDFAPAEYLELYDRPDFRYMNSRGREGEPPARSACTCGGWYVMKSAWGEKPFEDQRHVFFKCSENRTHSHRDQLEVLLYAYGRELLTDPGMTDYGSPSSKVASSTAFHSTICINESDQQDKAGEHKGWAAGKQADFADAAFHYGTVIGRRQLLFLKGGPGPDYCFIHDRIHGRGIEHTMDVSFHFSEGPPPVKDGRSVRTSYAEGGNLLVVGAGESPEPAIGDYWIADVKRGEVPAKFARYRVKSMPVVRFDTFLVPYSGTKAPEFSVAELTLDGADGGKPASAFSVKTASGTDIVLANAEPGTRMSFGGGRVISDAQAVALRFDASGALAYALQYGGTETLCDGKNVITVKQGEAFAEWTKVN